MATVYDSRAFVKRLTEAGMPERQADTLANENLLLIAEHLATKVDLKALATKEELHAEIAALRDEMVTKSEFNAGLTSVRAELLGKFEALDSKVGALESRLVAKLGSIMAAIATVLAALIMFT